MQFWRAPWVGTDKVILPTKAPLGFCFYISLTLTESFVIAIVFNRCNARAER